MRGSEKLQLAMAVAYFEEHVPVPRADDVFDERPDLMARKLVTGAGHALSAFGTSRGCVGQHQPAHAPGDP